MGYPTKLVTLESGLPYQAGYPRKQVNLVLIHFLFFLHRVYKEAKDTRVGGLPYLRARVTLAGR